MTICDFQFKRTENHNFTNNQYEPACGILSLLDISHFHAVFGEIGQNNGLTPAPIILVSSVFSPPRLENSGSVTDHEKYALTNLSGSVDVDSEAPHLREQRPQHGQRPVERSTDDCVATHDDIQTEVICNDHRCGGSWRHCGRHCRVGQKRKITSLK